MSHDPFVTHRSLLFTVAYEMLGSAADAEDVVQETWLRWAGIGSHDEIRDPRAYLVRMVTRQALNRLRTVARQREDYVGQWLPEPLLTSPDVADDVELAESVSIAMLTVLETLGPAERAVFVLHEVFDVSYDEVAAAVGKSPAAVRQIAHRARAHVAARRPRVDVSRTEQQQVLDRFLAALTTGDMQSLMDVLAPDVVVVADGGGFVPAARKPFAGAEKLIGLLVTAIAKMKVEFAGTPVWLNGAPGARLTIDDHGLAGGEGPVSAAVSLTVEHGRITGIYIISNPQKLERLDAEAALAR
jgi:RNA polymerase sigma-70 factor (ECF subfamily)